MTNCSLMGQDWTALFFWQYVALLTEWNARHSIEKPRAAPEQIDALKAAMKAHAKG